MNIYELKEGRELDVLVAENLMDEVFESLPYFSTSIADAWLVVDRMEKHFKQGLLLHCPGSSTYCDNCHKFKNYYARFEKIDDEYYHNDAHARGESASHAICLAALKAIEQTNKDANTQPSPYR